jgi:hypothetical protein
MLIAGATPYGAVGMSSGSSSSSTGAWMSSAMTAIQQSQNQGGLLGMMQDMASGSLGGVTSAANDFATISQTSTTNYGAYYAQLASQNNKQKQVEALQKAVSAMQQSQQVVQAQNVNPYVFLPGGATIDTTNNIMTMSDGTKYDTLTGAKYVDPASVIQLANGAYLDTQNNVLTMPNGTQIDTVTGLTVSTTA